jgi:Rad3-related DNA helicase
MENTIPLIPVLTIWSEGADTSEENHIKKNTIHTNWLNTNYQNVKTELLNVIKSKKGKGLFFVHNYNESREYKSYWTSINDFRKKRFPEKEGKQIIELIEWSDPTTIILFFCDDISMTLYHIT